MTDFVSRFPDKKIPVHTLSETDETSCKVMKFREPSDDSDVVEAHRHNYYEILFFQNEGGSHMIDFDVHELQACSIHFISPGQIHALQRKKKIDGYVVIFTKEFLVLNGINISVINDFPAFNKIVFPVLKMEEEIFTEILSLVRQMKEEYEKNSILHEPVLAAYLQLLLVKCRALLVNTDDYKKMDESARHLMQRFNILLEEHFITFHKVNDFAEKLNVTPGHLSDSLKKLSGKTAGELIHQRLILEAKRLLIHTSFTSKEIAYQLNFTDPSYFSRFFKTNTSHSPESFRKEIRKKYHH